jgi:hypothetical protein
MYERHSFTCLGLRWKGEVSGTGLQRKYARAQHGEITGTDILRGTDGTWKDKTRRSEVVWMSQVSKQKN